MGRTYAVLALLWLGCGSSPARSHQPDASPVGDGAAAQSDAARASDAGVPDAGDTGSGTAPDAGICTYDPAAGAPADCPSDLPSMCGDPAPSYSGSVASIFDSECGACHRPGGMAADKPLDTYAHVYKIRTTVLNRLVRCIMPPACAPQPTSEQRHALLQWLVCGAPDN